MLKPTTYHKISQVIPFGIIFFVSGLLYVILEKGIIERAIRKTSGNKVHAASLLGINRNTLRNKMERYGIKGID